MVKLTRIQRQVFTASMYLPEVEQIAQCLGMKARSVHGHLQSVYAAFGVSSRAELLLHPDAKASDYQDQAVAAHAATLAEEHYNK